jgi:hypothetical protein
MTPTEKIFRALLARLDRMTGEEMLTWLDNPMNQPLFSESRKPDSFMNRARRHVEARLDRLTR